MVASLLAECVQHGAMSFSSLVMECADVLISKGVSYGCDSKKDAKSFFLNRVSQLFHMDQDKTVKTLRISAYALHILAAYIGLKEAYCLLEDGFETPGFVNLAITTIVASLNVWNYLDTGRIEANQTKKRTLSGSQALSLSGMKAMAQTNFCESAGLVVGLVGTAFGFVKAGNYGVIAGLCGVIGLMTRQIGREVKGDPYALSLSKETITMEPSTTR